MKAGWFHSSGHGFSMAAGATFVMAAQALPNADYRGAVMFAAFFMLLLFLAHTHAMRFFTEMREENPAPAPDVAYLQAFHGAVYEQAGDPPALHEEEPVWTVDLFEVERKVKQSETQGARSHEER